MGGHGFDRVEHIGDGYVLFCECGWRSRPEPRAEVVGDEWDRHRRHAGSDR